MGQQNGHSESRENQARKSQSEMGKNVAKSATRAGPLTNPPKFTPSVPLSPHPNSSIAAREGPPWPDLRQHDMGERSFPVADTHPRRYLCSYTLAHYGRIMLQCSWINLFQESRNPSDHRKRNGPEIRTRAWSRSNSDNTVMKPAVKRSDGSFRQERRRKKNFRDYTTISNFQWQRYLRLPLLQQHLLWPKISRFVDASKSEASAMQIVSERAAFWRTAVQSHFTHNHN
jgi:hypothetical protein